MRLYKHLAHVLYIVHTHYILNAKNLAPLSISIFSGSKLITSYFSIIQMMCRCRKIFLVTNSNAWECLGIQRRLFGEKCQNIYFLTKTFLKMIFYSDNNFQLIFMMLQINCTKHFLNLAENVLFMHFLKK